VLSLAIIEQNALAPYKGLRSKYELVMLILQSAASVWNNECAISDTKATARLETPLGWS
jgi:hypothetical protein